MTEHLYSVTTGNFNVADSLILNAGDSLKIIGGSYTTGIYSTASYDVSQLQGNFPPEINKTTVYFITTVNNIAIMKNYVTLNTEGTYTFKKGYSTASGSFLTVNVVSRPSNVIHANVNGTWKEATPYVNVNGTWKEATPYVNVNGTWKESN